jgi:SAM-dependent methyltransferase
VPVSSVLIFVYHALTAVQSSEGEMIDLVALFVELCQALPAPAVLELGTRRVPERPSTCRTAWVPHARTYLGTDLHPGLDVDLVADVHWLADQLGEERFDAIISCSTFEHLKYPHLAAHQIMRTLRVGGIVFVQTHQSFPLHAHPYDYFRFSREALAGLFGTRMGFQVLATDYEFPAQIHADRDPAARHHPAFLNVRLVGQKQAPTPRHFIYKFDTG